MQAEHNKSQNALFELTSQKEEREMSRQHDAEQAATDLEEAHKKLRHVCFGLTPLRATFPGCCLQSSSLGLLLLLGTEAPVMTPTGVDYSLFSGSRFVTAPPTADWCAAQCECHRQHACHRTAQRCLACCRRD